MQVWNVLHVARWKIQDAENSQKVAIWASSHKFVGLYLWNWGTYRQSQKQLLGINTTSTWTHNMVNFGSLAAEIGRVVWGTPANFNGFRVLAALLQRCRSPEANQTLHDAWPSPGLLHYIYIFGVSCPLTEFCPVQDSLYVQVLRSATLTALLGRQPNFGAWYKEWNYTSFAEGANYIRLGGHHVGH